MEFHTTVVVNSSQEHGYTVLKLTIKLWWNYTYSHNFISVWFLFTCIFTVFSRLQR